MRDYAPLTTENSNMTQLTLTGKEIKDLAESIGFTITKGSFDKDILETEMTVVDCPEKGVEGDDGKPMFFNYVAYFDDCPEEGVMPLGDEVGA